MQTKVILACSLAAFVAIAGGTAEATGLIHTGNIAKGAVTLDRLAPKVQKMVTEMPKSGTNGTNGIDGIPGAPGAKGATGETGPMGPAGETGAPGTAAEKGDKGDTGLTGADGLVGPKGDAGLKGDTGLTGPKGDIGLTGPKGDAGLKGDKGDTGLKGDKGDKGLKGDAGDTGLTGPKGDDGKDGTNGVDAPARQYGIAQVMVSRGGAPATAWATYSTLLGSPVGDTTGGTFRFTCSSAKAPCSVGVAAKVTGSDHTIYPRLMIYNAGDGNGQASALTTCEYLDGPFTNVTSAGVTVGLAAGGSYDCGLLSTTDHTDANFGMVTNALMVPAGYYDVHSTFTFAA